jgi:hypothetical protein
VAFWIAVGSVVVMAGWSVATATYFAFRDDVLKGLIARQTEQQFAYEDRLAELRAQIDRTTSRQLLDQVQFERKIEELARREATLESHATALGGIADSTPTGSIRGTSRGADASGAKPSPAALAAHRRSDHGASLEPFRAPAGGKRDAHVAVNARLDSIEASLDRVEKRQAAAARDGGALPRQGPQVARRARRAGPQARPAAASERRPLRSGEVYRRRPRLRARTLARQSGADAGRAAQPCDRCRCASR